MTRDPVQAKDPPSSAELLRVECLRVAISCYAVDDGCDPVSVMAFAMYFYEWCVTGQEPDASKLPKRE